MKHILLFVILGLVGAEAVRSQPVSLYENRGQVTNPQIDATSVVNFGTIFTSTAGFIIGEPLLFDTQDTLFLTNMPSGVIQGSIGFRFDYSTAEGRSPSSVFFNRGIIEALDSSSFYIIGGGPVGQLGGGSFTLVSAQNIRNSGLLSAGGQGVVRITGNNVDLSRGGIRAAAPPSQVGFGGRGFSDGTNYNNVTGVEDVNWRLSTNRVDVSTFPIQYSRYAKYAYTNQYDLTNLLVQVVFLNTNLQSTNLSAKVRFAPGSSSGTFWINDDPSDPAKIAVVEYALPDIDITTSQPLTNYIYLLDTSALYFLSTNYIMQTNISGINPTERPACYEITLSTPTEWLVSTTNNTAFTNTLIYSPNSITNIVTNSSIASYSARISLPNGVPTSTGGSTSGDVGFLNPSNWYGRVEIGADNLNLNLTRIRAESLVSIKSPNLVDGRSLIMDAPHIHLDFGSTNGLLVISNSILPSVKRLTGTVTARTYVYTNQVQEVLPAVTNVYNVLYHLLIVDNNLIADQTVTVDRFTAHSTNLVISDPLIVNSTFLIDADNVWIQTNITLSAESVAGGDVSANNFPHLLNLTNSGTIDFPNVGRFGSDRHEPLNSLINLGTIQGSAQLLRAKTIENSGSIYSFSGPISIDAEAAKLDNGYINGNGDLTLTVGDLKAHATTVFTTNSALIFYVTNRLSDGGVDSGSQWTCSGGLQLMMKPQAGDLLGSQIQIYGPPFTVVSSTWAGENRGTNVSGYTDNVAVGHLILDGAQFSQFSFSGTGTNNAMYVDYLDLRHSATNYLSSLQFNTNMVLYFATANLPVEQLDGQFNGRLRWVNSYAGANSSTNVTLTDGRVITVNRSLATSSTLDTDADGVVNGRDSQPFGGVRISSVTVSNSTPPIVLISWTAAAQMVYQVQYATNMLTPAWQPLLSVTNTASTNKVLTVQDPNGVLPLQRYYRVNYTP